MRKRPFNSVVACRTTSSSSPHDRIDTLWPGVFNAVNPARVRLISSPSAEMTPTVLIACSRVVRVSNAAASLAATDARKPTHRMMLRMFALSDLEIERIGCAKADGGLVRRTAARHERTVGGGAKQFLVFDIGAHLPLRIDPVGDLAAEANGVRAPLGFEHRQS